MTQYSQRDTRWAKKLLANGPDTISMSGCFITSLAMLADITPPKVNARLLSAGAFNGQLLSNHQKAAEALSLTYSGRSINKPSTIPCIAETDHYASSGVPQHFFVYNGDTIIDPLDGKVYPTSRYKIVSYRLYFKQVKNDVVKNLFQKGNDIVWNIRSHNLAISDPDSLKIMFGDESVNQNPDSALVNDPVTARVSWKDVVDVQSIKSDLEKTDQLWKDAKSDLEATDKLRIKGLETIKLLEDKLAKSNAEIADAYALGVREGVKNAPTKEVIKEVLVPTDIKSLTISQLFKTIWLKIRGKQ